MHFRLVSPEKILIDEDVNEIILPTTTGQIGILPHHANLTSSLAPGIVTVKQGSKSEDIAVSTGFVQVKNGDVTVLAETADRGEDLDVSVIEEAKKRAEEAMKAVASRDDISFALAAAAVERELARLKLAVKYKHQRRPE